MAKNYTFAEAVKIINEGTDLESIFDIGRRYPILLHKVTAVTAKAGDVFVDLMNYMPDYLTANKVNTALKNAVNGNDNEESEEAEVKEEKADEAEGKVTWDESMSAKQLWELLGKAGKRKLAKSTKKADLVEACKQAFGAVKEADEEEADEENENQYEGKSAMELFKECKERGIKTAPKKTAKFYAELLMKDDAEQASKTDDSDEDWDSDEDVKESKKSKKAEKKTAKKEESDDDDDWDI